MNHILDNDIVLNEELHEYRLIDRPEASFTSVTTYVEHFFEGFDALKIATKLVNNHPKYSDHTVESLMAEWKATADYGTRVHHEIEKWIKERIEPEDKKAIHGRDWLAQYELRSDMDVLSEVIVYSTELSIAGTVDILAKDNATGEYDIIDWKTSKKIETASYRKKMGTHPSTRHVMDCNFYHYSLQLSLYRYILEQYYGLKIHNQLIGHLKDDGVHALVTPYMRDEINEMLRHREEMHDIH
jgi:ATP-dependent exoDNAse (exonuclease V) beta subunit